MCNNYLGNRNLSNEIETARQTLNDCVSRLNGDAVDSVADIQLYTSLHDDIKAKLHSIQLEPEPVVPTPVLSNIVSNGITNHIPVDKTNDLELTNLVDNCQKIVLLTPVLT